MKQSYLLFALFLVGPMITQLAAQQPEPVSAAPLELIAESGLAGDGRLPVDAEPLMRGPIHEAYAEPIGLEDEEKAIVVVAEPPAPVEEIPPDAKPDGDRVTWIPGYWSWDDERQDYIWVSGVWRKRPVGRDWMPGRWSAVEHGHQWISGRWVPDDQANDEVLPVPPPTLERGPTSQARRDGDFWVPGSWQFRERRYVWRPGFWSPSRNNWVWVPDHYVTAARGCHFVSGYWDYGWDDRGTLYAPCYINRDVAYGSGYYYSPSVVVDVSGAFFHLWVRPAYRHYYFGDYYATHYASHGYRPWYDHHAGYRRGYDPMFSYYYWRYRGDHVDLYHQLRRRHDYYQGHVASRPAHRWNGTTRRGHRNGRLTNAEREALIHRPADRRALAIEHNQREAIRERILQQHRERLRTGGDSLAGAGTLRGVPNARRRTERNGANATNRLTSQQVRRRRTKLADDVASSLRRERPNDQQSVNRNRQAIHANNDATHQPRTSLERKGPSNNKLPGSVPSPLPRAARIAGGEGRVRGRQSVTYFGTGPNRAGRPTSKSSSVVRSRTKSRSAETVSRNRTDGAAGQHKHDRDVSRRSRLREVTRGVFNDSVAESQSSGRSPRRLAPRLNGTRTRSRQTAESPSHDASSPHRPTPPKKESPASRPRRPSAKRATPPPSDQSVHTPPSRSTRTRSNRTRSTRTRSNSRTTLKPSSPPLASKSRRSAPKVGRNAVSARAARLQLSPRRSASARPVAARAPTPRPTVRSAPRPNRPVARVSSAGRNQQVRRSFSRQSMSRGRSGR